MVGAHYDLDGAGRGAVDNWSGASLLPSLYQALAMKPRKHKFLFVAFSAEEAGLIGSTHFVKTLSREEKAAIAAFVNLDCIGMGPPNVWLSRADKWLAETFAGMGKALRVPVGMVDVDRVGTDDSLPFGKDGIPTLSVHSVTQANYRVPHSAADRLDALRREDYYETYRLLCAWLVYLDSTP